MTIITSRVVVYYYAMTITNTITNALLFISITNISVLLAMFINAYYNHICCVNIIASAIASTNTVIITNAVTGVTIADTTNTPFSAMTATGFVMFCFPLIGRGNPLSILAGFCKLAQVCHAFEQDALGLVFWTFQKLVTKNIAVKK